MTVAANMETAWLNVKNDIELKIISGEYSAGDRIPPVRKIATIYSIGTTTAAKVLEHLYQEGTIYKRRGVGYFVKPYTKDRLCIEHKKNLEKIITDSFAYADALGVDMMVIVSQIYKVKDKKM